MSLNKVPSADTLSDQQFIQVQGPDQILSGFQYDAQTRALYSKESQVVLPGFHGPSHIAEDPVPNATCDSPGLMAVDDKCKLDALIQTRLGVLGFQGAGFADDGGFLQGDILLAAGSEFISLERVGNIVRFTVDAPLPLNCECFLPDARVLMHNGKTKPIKDIMPGDMVVTHEGRPKKVKNLIRNMVSDHILRWEVDKHSGEAFGITGNHPVKSLQYEAAYMPSGKRRKSTTLKESASWIEAKDINPGSFVARRRSSDIVKDVATIDILEYLGSGFVDLDGLVFPLRPDNNCVDGQAHGIPRFIEVTDDFLDLIGFFAAEGCASRRNGLRFSINTKELVFGDIGYEIIRICSEIFGLEPSINDRQTENGKDIQIHSAVLGVLFRNWFDIKSKRHYPDWVMLLPSHKQSRIISSSIKGDGYITNHASRKYIQLGLCSRDLIDQSLWMAERCGWEPSNPQPTYKNGKYKRYRMSITDSNAPDLCDILKINKNDKKLSRELHVNDDILHRLNSVTKEYYNGIVYNFEVEDDNSYIVDGIVVHNCESCAQIFWVQDETDVASIRPPSCAGKLPGVNAYGEMKIYLMPESLIVDPANPGTTLNTKDQYPSLVFKRYDDSLQPGEGEYDLVLKRDPNNLQSTYVGWAMTPGPAGVPECVWFMGNDNIGNRIRYELNPESEAGLLGQLLYKGHNLTKVMAVITDYTSQVLSTNIYSCKQWDTVNEVATGDEFTATNIWQYNNPEGPDSGVNAKALVLDRTIGLLPIGTLVDMWFFKVAEVNNTDIRRYFFVKQPQLKDCDIWSRIGGVEFGDVLTARSEVDPSGDETDIDAAEEVSSSRDFEKDIWGLTGFDDPLYLWDDSVTGGATEIIELNTQHKAVIDETLPGLRVEASSSAPDPFSERPVFLWNRQKAENMLVTTEIGRPDSSAFPPYDILLHAQIDSKTNTYMKVVEHGTFADSNQYWVRIRGVHWHDMPEFGAIRILRFGDAGTGGAPAPNLIWNYTTKVIFPSADEDTLVLVGSREYPNTMGGTGLINDTVELLHQEYSAPCVRVEFDIIGEEISVQFKVGTLDMSAIYEENVSDDKDDYVRGMTSYAVSSIYVQSEFYSGAGDAPSTNIDGWIVYDGGAVMSGSQPEFWNQLEIMQRGNQVWIWWNELLIPPNPSLSGALSPPNPVSTPYFPVDLPSNYGKFGMRLWPGAKVRRAQMRAGARGYNEFQRGQLLLS